MTPPNTTPTRAGQPGAVAPGATGGAQNLAWSVQDQARDRKLRAAYDAATTPAQEAFDAAMASAHEAYDAATTPAQEAYDAAMASAEAAYNAATATAEAALEELHRERVRPAPR